MTTINRSLGRLAPAAADTTVLTLTGRGTC